MTEYYEKYASDKYKAAVDADGGVAKSFVTYDGKMLGLPHPGATPDSVQFMYIRQDWLDELGLSMPTSLDELIDVARAFVENNMGGENTIGIAAHKDLGSGWIGSLDPLFAAYKSYWNCWVDDGNGGLAYSFVQPETKQALQTLQNLYAEGLLAEDFAAVGTDAAQALLASGKCGIGFGPNWLGDRLYNSEIMEAGDWAVAEGVMADGSPYVFFGKSVPDRAIFVRKGMEHPEAIVKMMNLWYELRDSQEGYEMNVHTYEKDGNETTIEAHYYSFAPAAKVPWSAVTTQKTIWEAIDTGDDSALVNTSNYSTYLDMKAIQEGEMDIRLAGQELIWGREGTFGMIGKMWDEGRIIVDKFQTQPSEYMKRNSANINAILYSECLKIIMGQDIDTFDDAVDVWLSTGGEKITQEVNEWYQTTK